jgi:hypothetical protein
MDGLPIEDDNAVLASVTVPLEAIPSPRAFLSFDVSSFRVLVSPGELLAIVLTGNARWYGVAPGIGTPGLVEVLAEPAMTRILEVPPTFGGRQRLRLSTCLAAAASLRTSGFGPTSTSSPSRLLSCCLASASLGSC